MLLECVFDILPGRTPCCDYRYSLLVVSVKSTILIASRVGYAEAKAYRPDTKDWNRYLTIRCQSDSRALLLFRFL